MDGVIPCPLSAWLEAFEFLVGPAFLEGLGGS